MGPTLDMHAFAGSHGDAAPGRRAFVGEARFDGYFVTVSMARAQAAACLPEGLSPAQPLDEGRATHPAVFVFGLQSDTAVLFGGGRWPTGFRYLEAALLVPFVCLRGDPRLHSYLPRMYAGDRWATWTGNATYGYNKVSAALHWMSDTLAVSEPGRGVVLEAKVDSEMPWARAGEPAAEGFASVHALANLPVAGRRADGSIVASYFEWDLAAASLRPARASVSVAASVVAGVAAHTYAGVDGETFEVRNLRWRVSWPAAPSR